MLDIIRRYYWLTKPGIIYGNLMTAVAGYLLAARLHLYIRPIVGVLVGFSLVIASACVVNNYIDRDIDKRMARTRKRALVTGKIKGWHALLYAVILAVIGFLALALATNPLTLSLGIIAYIDYVGFYTYLKRKSVHGTLVGSICGALPLTAGYTSVANRFDTTALALFLLMTFWQMPHFYAIALYRQKDYAAAKIPVLPVVKGVLPAKRQTMAYIIAFGLAATLLVWAGKVGIWFLVVMLLVSGWWLLTGLRQWKGLTADLWGKKMFLRSLVVLVVLSVLVSVGSFLP